ncbi:MAG: hypothetical protein ACR2GU_09690 [Rubrobacteraceae bacterium]
MIGEISGSVAVQVFIAAVLSWIDLNLYKTSHDPRTPPGEAVLIDLWLGLVTVAAVVLWLGAAVRIFYQ